MGGVDMGNIKITLPQIPSLKIVLPGQGGTSITVDSEMSDTSTNPVQNKVAKKYMDKATEDLSKKALSVTKITDLFKLEYGLSEGVYQLIRGTKIVKKVRKMSDTFPPTTTLEWEEVEYTPVSDIIAIVGKTEIDENEKILITVTFVGNIKSKENDGSCESVLMCYIRGDYPGSVAIEPIYDVSFETVGGGGVSQEYVDDIASLRLQPWWIDYEYKKGDLVLLTGERYDDVATYVALCIEDHNSGYSIDTSKWEEVGYIKSRYDEAGNIIHETYATKEELENFTSNEKVYDYSSETTNDLILEHNSLYYFGVLTTLNLAISSNVNIESVDVPFECSIMFTSGETATNLDYSASPIIWSGDDCDSDGHFVPETNKTYEISIKKLGLIISARVGVI